MKLSRRLLVFLLFLPSIAVFPQKTATAADSSGEAQKLANLRAARLKNGLLQEIKSLPRTEQAYFYAQLAETLWVHDQKEAHQLLVKGVEIGISHPADYKDGLEKLSGCSKLLYIALKKDVLLADKLIAKIKEIKIDESDSEMLAEANKIYLSIAQAVFTHKQDENLAFEFALLSLKGAKPAIGQQTVRLLLGFRQRNENLANLYFDQILKSVEKNRNPELAAFYLFNDDFDTFSKIWRQEMPDAQIRAFLELLLPAIRKNADDLAQKNSDDCYLVKNWGLKNLDEYKRLLPEKAPLVEQAVDSCQNAAIEERKKPYYKDKPRRTSGDFLERARQTVDQKLRAADLSTAASFARNEKDYRLANEILDSIENEYRGVHWHWLKIQANAELIQEYLKTDDFVEIENALAAAPPELRVFIVVQSLQPVKSIKPTQKELVLNLLNRARADFNRIERFPADPLDFNLNPTKFGQMVQLYIKFGFVEEAVTVHEEAIKSFNRLVVNLPARFKDAGRIPRQSSYARFDNQWPRTDLEFIKQYFDRINDNLGKIENHRVRLAERMILLKTILEKPTPPPPSPR